MLLVASYFEDAIIGGEVDPNQRWSIAMLDNAIADLQAFTHYAEIHLAADNGPTSLEQSLSAFRDHQRDLERLREHLAPSLAEAKRGEAKPLDAEALFARIRQSGNRIET